jgi:hypothetical protein
MAKSPSGTKKKVLIFEWRRLFERADVVRRKCSASWRDVAKEIGVTPSVFTRISTGLPVKATTLIKLLRFADARFEDCVAATFITSRPVKRR